MQVEPSLAKINLLYPKLMKVPKFSQIKLILVKINRT
jgi:hypothetical protein